MTGRQTAAWLAGLVGVGWVASAQAGPVFPQSLGGSFTGIVTGSYDNLGGSIDGQTVTGTFSVADMGCAPLDGFSGSSCGPVAMDIVLNVAGITVVWGGPPEPFNVLSVANAAGRQKLLLLADYTDPYFSATMVLTGAAHAFVNGTNYQTLHAGAADGGSLYFMDGRELGGAIDLTSIVVNGIPVSEPPAWPLYGAALLGLAGVRRPCRRHLGKLPACA